MSIKTDSIFFFEDSSPARSSPGGRGGGRLAVALWFVEILWNTYLWSKMMKNHRRLSQPALHNAPILRGPNSGALALQENKAFAKAVGS